MSVETRPDPAAPGSSPVPTQGAPAPAQGAEDRDLVELLSALNALVAGDFAVRVEPRPGLVGQVAERDREVQGVLDDSGQFAEVPGPVVRKECVERRGAEPVSLAGATHVRSLEEVLCQDGQLVEQHAHRMHSYSPSSLARSSGDCSRSRPDGVGVTVCSQGWIDAYCA